MAELAAFVDAQEDGHPICRQHVQSSHSLPLPQADADLARRNMACQMRAIQNNNTRALTCVTIQLPTSELQASPQVSFFSFIPPARQNE